jgi:hypothetical protein
MNYPKSIALGRIAAHDFNRALRVWKKYLPNTEILRALVSERARALAICIRSFGTATIGILWLSTAKSTLALKLMFIDISILPLT